MQPEPGSDHPSVGAAEANECRISGAVSAACDGLAEVINQVGEVGHGLGNKHRCVGGGRVYMYIYVYIYIERERE